MFAGPCIIVITEE